MAVYDGFFDAELNTETGKYDKEYHAGDFVDYFGASFGSGVCVWNNPDSMRATLRGGGADIAPGYLFIQGYWLKNDAVYTVPLPASGEQAVIARLDSARRFIELTTQLKADPLPDDCLVLAYIDAGAGTCVDTRTDPELCGVIDAIGDLSSKVRYAVDYIDHQVEDRLDQAEADIAAQEARLDAKIAEVAAEVEKIVPPPVGTVKFTASESVEEGWLRCDGSFINEADYPELVAALGKLTPSGDKFQVLSDGEVSQQITNGVLYGGRMWVYSYAAGKLYGIDAQGKEPVKVLAVTSGDSHFSNFLVPSTAKPLCLSIVRHSGGSGAALFLTQIVQEGTYTTAEITNHAWMQNVLIFQTEFTGEEESLAMTPAFTSIDIDNKTWYLKFNGNICVPYVVSFTENGVETYYAAVGFMDSVTSSSSLLPDRIASLVWTATSTAAQARAANSGPATNSAGANPSLANAYQRFAYNVKTLKEGVGVHLNKTTSGISSYYSYMINSDPTALFDYSSDPMHTISESDLRRSYGPVNIIGEDYAVSSYDINAIPVFSRKTSEARKAQPGISLPSAARVFVDAGAYLWGKAIYLFFVGTGLIFSRTMQEGDFGYLDTTDVLGNITQFGYLDYSEDEGTLYLLGQDTQNHVKLAKIVLNTLYDYANDGAWLPMIASDGVPAYIKAKEAE